MKKAKKKLVIASIIFFFFLLLLQNRFVLSDNFTTAIGFNGVWLNFLHRVAQKITIIITHVRQKTTLIFFLIFKHK